MKRFTPIVAIMLLLSGCTGYSPKPTESIAESSSEETTDSKEVIFTDENAPTQEAMPKATTAAATEATATTATTEAAAPDVVEQTALPADFNLADYCGEYDEVQPLYYGVVDGMKYEEPDSDIMQIALDELKQSDLFKEVTDIANELFRYENGELVPTYETYLNWGYSEYISYDENNGIIVTPKLVYNTTLFNYGNLFAFAMPLPTSQLEWSGTSGFTAVVYTDSENNPQLLREVSAQTLYNIDILNYNDGAVHAVFQRGHTTGTSNATIIGFESGAPKIEYNGSALTLDNSIVGRYLCECGNYMRMLLFRDAEHGYCCIKGVPLPEEAAEMLISDEAATRACPDFRQHYENGNVFVYGGKYIAVGEDYDVTTYELINGLLCPCDDLEKLIGEKHYHNTDIKSFNINLNNIK